MDVFAAMRSFRRVVERGSFSSAAEDLRLSPAALSKQVRLLEEHLGVVLIHRTTRRMSLTEVGATYLRECCRLLDQLDEMERSVSDSAGAVAGCLRVNAPMSFGLTVLSPLLPKFLAEYPSLTLDLTLNDQLIDPVGEGFDVSIRVRPELPDSSLVARRLGEMEQCICAAPAYIEKHGQPHKLSDLHDHSCLTYRLAEHPGVWRLDGPDGSQTIELKAKVTANNSLLLRDLLLAGLGIGSLPSFIAAPLIAVGALVRLFPTYVMPTRTVFAIYSTHRHLQPKIRAFVDFLATELRN